MTGNSNIEIVQSEKKINITVDIVRFVCSLIVVSIHCLFLEYSSIQKTIWSFAVPFFAITSGFYFKYNDKHSYLILLKRMFFLIILGDIINYLPMIHAQYAAGHIYINWRYLFIENICLGHLWYLVAIIICSTLIFLIQKYINTIIVIIAILFLNLFFEFLNLKGINIVDKYGSYYTFCLFRTIVVLPYFYFGVVLKQYNDNHDTAKFSKIICIISFIILIIYFIVRRYIHKVHSSISAFYIPVLILIILYQFIQMKPFFISTDVRHAKILHFSSMVIYLIHPVVIYFLRIIYGLNGLELFIETLLISSFISFIIFGLSELIKTVGRGKKSER